MALLYFIVRADWGLDRLECQKANREPRSVEVVLNAILESQALTLNPEQHVLLLTDLLRWESQQLKGVHPAHAPDGAFKFKP